MPRRPRSRVRSALQSLALACTVTLATAAAADTPPVYPSCEKQPSPEDIQGAKGAHEAAKAFLKRGEYDKALETWRGAYSLDCTAHALLQNIASVYEAKGDKPNAIAALELYLEREPKAADADEVRTLMEGLKKSMEAEVAPKPPPPEAPVAAPPKPPPVAPPPKRREPERPYGVLPWIPVGVGGATLVTGAILLPLSLSKVADVKSRCPPGPSGAPLCANPADEEAGNAARGRATLGGVLLGAGALVAGGGLVWQFAFNERPASAAPPKTGMRLTPTWSPGSVGLTAAGKF